MKLQNDFQERTDDIEAYFSLLKFIDSIEAYKNIPIAYAGEPYPLRLTCRNV